MTDDEMKTLRVSTEAFHDDGGLDAFREIFGREILGIEIDPLEGHPLAIDLTLRSLPSFAMRAERCRRCAIGIRLRCSITTTSSSW
jgi:hypothetical protein